MVRSRETSSGTTFRVRFSNLGCTQLIAGLPTPMYVKIDFDSYKQFSSERVPTPKGGGAVQWEQQAAFFYRTKFRNKLRRKSLKIELWDSNSLSSDKLLGTTAVDLHTLATGPISHDLVLREAGKPVGHVVFDLHMEELGAPANSCDASSPRWRPTYPPM